MMNFSYRSKEKVLFTHHAVRADLINASVYLYDAVQDDKDKDKVIVTDHNSIKSINKFGGTIMSYKPLETNTCIDTGVRSPYDRSMGIEEYVSNYIAHMTILLLNDPRLTSPSIFGAKVTSMVDLISMHFDRTSDSIEVKFVDYTPYSNSSLSARQNRLNMISDISKQLSSATHVAAFPKSECHPNIDFIIKSVGMPKIDWGEITSDLSPDKKKDYSILFPSESKSMDTDRFLSPTYKFDEFGELRPLY